MEAVYLVHHTRNDLSFSDRCCCILAKREEYSSEPGRGFVESSPQSRIQMVVQFLVLLKVLSHSWDEILLEKRTYSFEKLSELIRTHPDTELFSHLIEGMWCPLLRFCDLQQLREVS